jgi:putative addiction module component (TIGR02574 family)
MVLVRADLAVADRGDGPTEPSTGVPSMTTSTLDSLLKLPPHERVELALALWESLSDADRDASFALTDEQHAELDRRMAEHLADPGSSVPWDEVRRELRQAR